METYYLEIIYGTMEIWEKRAGIQLEGEKRMSVELRARRKEAWEKFKAVRSYIRPLYYDSRNSLPIGKGSHRVLNSAGQKALAIFHAIDLKLKRGSWQR